MKPLRLLEMLPGILLWLTLILPLLFSFSHPYAVAIFMIFYTIIWLLRSFGFSFFLLKGYIKTHRYMKVDWQKTLNDFHRSDFMAILKKAPRETRDIVEPLYRRYLNRPPEDPLSPQEIIHLILIPTYKEKIEILRQSVGSVAESHFDLKKIIVVLATEARDHERGQKNAELLKQEFGGRFLHFWHFEHPANLPGEIPCKGSNIYYAGHRIREAIEKGGLKPSAVLLTTLDADNIFHPDYLACLTLFYVTEKDRKKKSYQSLPFFFNNIWEVPILNRIVATANCFWHIIQSSRPHRLWSSAAHSQPMDALIEMDFWNKNSITEDSHQFWRAYFHFKGEHEVVPLFMPVYQDAVQLETYWKTLKAQYLQLRRWAWGVSDLAFGVVNFWKNRRELPWGRTLGRLYVMLEGQYMWATAPLVIVLANPLPGLFNLTFQHSVQAYNITFLLNIFFKLALISIVVATLMTLIMLPPHPQQKWIGRLSLIPMWLLLPFTTIIFGAIPSIEAQTRLMLGKRLDFNVTEKVKKYVKIHINEKT